MTKARCNPLWQPIPCPLSDIEGLESWLGDMAAQGLVPVTIGQNFARFRCSQPKAVRYRLNAKPAPETFLESSPGTPDGEERALAQEYGWYYVTAVGDFFLYACEDRDAPELNTDPQVQALSLRYAKRQVFAPAGLLAYWLVTFWVRYAMGVWHTPVIDFVELGWLSFCYLGLLAAALVSVVHNTALLYRFSARLTRGAEPERHKNWRKGAGRYLVGRVLAALLFVLTIVWTFAGSAMEKSRHGSIPLEDYTAPLPFATLDDYAGQPTALDADAAPAASFVLVQRLPLAPTFIKYEAHGQAGANGLRGALYVEYYECITPQLAQTMYREGKTNGLHNFPETAADAANGSIYCRTLVDGNKVLRVLLYQDSKAVPMISLLEKSLGDRTAVLLGERAAADTLILTPRTVSGREMLDAVCMPVGIDPEDVLVLAGGLPMLDMVRASSQSTAAADAPAELRLAAQKVTLTDAAAGSAVEVLYRMVRDAENLA